jgi:hypothetical protein
VSTYHTQPRLPWTRGLIRYRRWSHSRELAHLYPDYSCPSLLRIPEVHRRLHLRRGSGRKPSRTSRNWNPVQRRLYQRCGSSTRLFTGGIEVVTKAPSGKCSINYQMGQQEEPVPETFGGAFQNHALKYRHTPTRTRKGRSTRVSRLAGRGGFRRLVREGGSSNPKGGANRKRRCHRGVSGRRGLERPPIEETRFMGYPDKMS